MRYKSVFISDVHLGTKACKAKRLHAFLNSVECDWVTNCTALVENLDGSWELLQK